MDKFSPFSTSMRLFHAQSLLCVATMSLPFGEKYDVLRKELFDASMQLLRCCNALTDLENA